MALTTGWVLPAGSGVAPSLALIACGAVAMMAAGRKIDGTERGAAAVGEAALRIAVRVALILGMAAAAIGLLAGWSYGISAVVAGAGIAAAAAQAVSARSPAWWATPVRRAFGVTRSELAALGGLAVVVVAGAVWIISSPHSLVHDEAVYALQAESWLTGGQTNSVGAHRGPLLSILLMPIVALSAAESALRSVGFASGLLGIASVWTLGRVVFGPVAAWIGAAAFALAPPVLDASGLALTDLPAACLLIFAAAVCWWQFELRPKPDRGLLLLAPLVAAALMLRYGSALPAAVLALTVVVLWPTKAWTGRARILQSAALLLVLWIPEGVRATRQFGTPWGRIVHTSRAARSEEIGAGLRGYAEMFPNELAGPLVAAFIAMGAAAGIVAVASWLIRRPIAGSRRWAFLLLPAAAQLVLMGINSPADSRFVLFAIGLGCAAGAGVAAWLLRMIRSSAGQATAAACLAVVACSLLAHGAASASAIGLERRERDRGAVVRQVGLILAADRAESCVVMTTFIPQLEWYSGCQGVGFTDARASDQLARLQGNERFLFFYGEGKRQPPPEERAAFTEAPGVRVITELDGVDGRASLYRLPGTEPISGRS